MLELNPFRKNKVNLEDYDYLKDIQNRLMMSTLSQKDLIVLEEMLYSPPKMTIHRLAEDLEMDETALLPILEKLMASDLFQIKDHQILVNKEMRKYFESQLLKFEEDFVPGMEYLQSLLRKVPFHTLLNWYPIPRTSDNIFDSLIEKYLLTPQVFQRYLMELNFGNPKMSAIVEEVFNSPDFQLSASHIKKKYELTNEEFQEILLVLEFNFVCCLVYQKSGNDWVQAVTPFHEWREYLRFLRDAKPTPIASPEKVKQHRKQDFAFIEDTTALLKLIKQSPLSLRINENESWTPDKPSLKKLTKLFPDMDFENQAEETLAYISKLIHKLLFLKLAKIDESSLHAYDSSDEWLALSIENRALATYKHTLSRLDQVDFSEIATERNIREIEKSISSVVHLGWVAFEDFLKTIAAPISENSRIMLKKVGKTWKYTLPEYTDTEKKLIQKTIIEWLFEAGVVQVGTFKNADCFRVTPFGQTIFS